jgi:predicted O-methyltransferase YrrM
MSEALWDAVDRWIADRLLPPDPALEAAVAASEAAGLPPIAVAPNQGKFLHLLARLMGARRILEIGTLGGYSTIWLARALPPNGCLISLEADARHAEIARASIARAGLAGLVEVRVGRALDLLPQLASAGGGPFDLVFIDADKANNAAYLDWSLRLTRAGSLIVADNVVRDGAVIDPVARSADMRGIRRMFELMAAEPRLSATAIQTVGSKGYDGLAIALVVADG